jgi:hypothetical protein
MPLLVHATFQGGFGRKSLKSLSIRQNLQPGALQKLQTTGFAAILTPQYPAH